MSLSTRHHSNSFSRLPGFGSGSRLGINRRTWDLGKSIGRGLKRAYDSRNSRSSAVKKVKTEDKKSFVKPGIPQGRVMNEGTGGQYSMFFKGGRKCFLPKHVEDALPPLAVVTNGAVQLKSAIGKQAIYSTEGLFLPTTATTYTGDKITRVLYKSASQDITLNNIYLSNAYVIIYDIFARKDVANSTISKPDIAWIQGGTDESTANSYSFLGSTPWQVEVFNQFYRVEQVTNVVLGAGATHVHKVRIKPEAIVSSAYAQYSPYAFKDVTYFCMIEVHGSPANDTVTQTQVGIGAGGLNIVVDREETLKQLQRATPTLNVTNSLITAFTTAEQVVNLGGSTITTNAEG